MLLTAILRVLVLLRQGLPPGLLSAIKAQGADATLRDQRIVVCGAGSAGLMDYARAVAVQYY